MDKDLFGEPVDVSGRKLWTTTELGREAGVSAARVRQLCLAGRLPGAVHLGRDWAIPDDAAQVWLKHDRDRRLKDARK